MKYQYTKSPSSPVEDIVHRTGMRPFSLHFTQVPSEDKSALYFHCHPEAELFYLAEGTVVFTVENQSYTLHAGEGIFIPPDCIHSAEKKAYLYDTEKNTSLYGTDEKNCIQCAETQNYSAACSFYAIVFSTAMLEQSLPPYCQEYFSALRNQKLNCIYPIINDSCNQALLALLPEIFKYFNSPLQECELRITGLLLSIWQELYNLCFHAVTTVSKSDSSKVLLQASVDYIQQNFSEDLSLGMLAAQIGLSEGHYCRSFKAYTGSSPFTYLNKIRIIKSCELLTGTDKKITDIAVLCGFNNISYFNRIFVKFMGMTPSSYRQNS